MKNMMKIAMLAGVGTIVGGGIYLMKNPEMKKKTGKAVLQGMDSVEKQIAKTMNN